MSEEDIFDYLQTTSLEPHDDYTSEITYKDQKIIWNRLKEKSKEIEELKEELKEANDSITWWQNRFNAIERDNIRLNNIINDLEEYIKPFLYMLNGITDKDEYEQAQLDTFTDIMEKLQELKGSDKE